MKNKTTISDPVVDVIIPALKNGTFDLVFDKEYNYVEKHGLYIVGRYCFAADFIEDVRKNPGHYLNMFTNQSGSCT